MLDTVNPHGGWQGSLDATQLGWLEAELTACAARPVVLFSHHPLETLVNDRRPPGADRRVLADELRDVLLGPPMRGRLGERAHARARDHRGPPERRTRAGFWQVTTASHIDWPQQARIIELLETDRGLAIACTVIDRRRRPATAGQGPVSPADLAALARELAANDWQVRDQITADGGAGAGTAADRNVVLAIEWPRPQRPG